MSNYNLGSLIIAFDGSRFLVCTAPNNEVCLLNLDTYKFVYPEIIDMYISQYHMGIASVHEGGLRWQ